MITDPFYLSWLIGIPLVALAISTGYAFTDKEPNWYGLVLVSISWPNVFLLGLIVSPFVIRKIILWGRESQ